LNRRGYYYPSSWMIRCLMLLISGSGLGQIVQSVNLPTGITKFVVSSQKKNLKS
jgi:hypothetical protein